MEVNMSFSPDSDDEYEKLIRRMNPPRVVIDNEACKNATVIRVDTANKHGILLEVVQILTDLNLIITTKAYISSDGGWLMDVFNVVDQDRNKITNEGILDYFRKSLGPEACFTSSTRSVGVKPTMDHTAIELTGSDRPGLLSEVSAVLTHLKCNVVNAEVRNHNTRVAAVMHVTDEETGGPITDPDRLSGIKEFLCNVLKGSNKAGGANTVFAHGVTHTDGRLYQMMFADRDYERADDDSLDDRQRPNVNVVNWCDKDYSVVTIKSKDRPKLLFDALCTLTDMQYVVFHANIDAEGPEAYQEYYIRHIDGSSVKSDAERERVIQCLEAAIERRVSEGLKLELCNTDTVGLLSDVTRILRENSLTVTRAEVYKNCDKQVMATDEPIKLPTHVPTTPPCDDALPKYLQEDEMTQERQDLVSSLPTEKGWVANYLHQYQGFWHTTRQLHGVLTCQKHFQAQDSDILLITNPKSGTTWLKALTFALMNRFDHYDVRNHPLLTTNSHELVPFLETMLYIENQVPDLTTLKSPRIFSSHLPLVSLPESVKDSVCKFVYLCRNPKDTFVSLWHFTNKLRHKEKGVNSLEEAFEKFCRGVSLFGPYWDHVLDYWKASLEKPERVLFFKYEEMIQDPAPHLRKLAKFLGCPFSPEEEANGLVDSILKLCSFDNLSNLEVNKTGKMPSGEEYKAFFRRGEVGDWMNHLTSEMVQKMDKITEEKLHASGLKF